MYVSFRDEVLTRAGYGSLSEGVTDLGVRALELTADDRAAIPWPDAPPTERRTVNDEQTARALRSQLHPLGLRISALRGPAGSHPAAWLPALTEAAETIGAPLVHVAEPWAPEGAAAPHHGAGLSDAIDQALAQTRRSSVALAVAASIAQTDASLWELLLLRTEEPRLALALDPGGLYRSGLDDDEVYASVRQLAPLARLVACTNWHRRPGGGSAEDTPRREHAVAGLDRGDLDYAHIVCLLGANGYAGALTIDAEASVDESPDVARQRLHRDADWLRELVGDR